MHFIPETATWRLFSRFGWRCGVMIVLAAHPALGDEPAEIDDDDDRDEALVEELILGESPDPQEAGELQATFSYAYLDGREANTSDLVLELEYGITDVLQIGMEVPYGFINANEAGEDDVDGVRDLSLGVLWNFYRDDAWTLSSALEVGFPTGDEDEELGEGDVEFEPQLLGVWRSGDLEVYGGIGAELTDSSEAFTYSAGVVVDTGAVALLAEVAGVTAAEEDEENVAFFASGVAVKLADNVELLGGVPIGLNTDTPDWGFTLRLTIEF